MTEKQLKLGIFGEVLETIKEFGKDIGGGLSDVGKGLEKIANSIDNIKPILDDGVDVKIGRKNKIFGRK